MPHRRRLALTALALSCLLPALASAATPYRSPQQILDASAASDRQYWDDCSDDPRQSACRTPLN